MDLIPTACLWILQWRHLDKVPGYLRLKEVVISLFSMGKVFSIGRGEVRESVIDPDSLG